MLHNPRQSSLSFHLYCLYVQNLASSGLTGFKLQPHTKIKTNLKVRCGHARGYIEKNNYLGFKQLNICLWCLDIGSVMIALHNIVWFFNRRLKHHNIESERSFK